MAPRAKPEEPPIASSGTTRLHDARQSTSSGAAKAAPGQQQVPKSYAMSCLEKCPPDVLAIFKKMIGVMDLSDTDLLPIPGRALNIQQRSLKGLLTGLFPGITEELYCVADGGNADMCPDLVSAAARHVNSFVQVWKSEARNMDLDLPQLLHRKVKTLGYEPSDLPADIKGAICDINTRAWADPPDKMALHRCNTIVLSLLPDCHRPGAGGSSDFWLLKAVAQQFDLRIYHATDARAVQADRALLAGKTMLLLNPRELPLPEDKYCMTTWTVMREVLQKHAVEAQAKGRSLRAHFEDTAGFRRDDWGAGKADVSHLIAILADRVSAQEDPPGKAWSTLAKKTPDIAGVMESAFKIKDAPGGDTKYAALWTLFPGLPQHPSSAPKDDAGSQLLFKASYVRQHIQVHKYKASLDHTPFNLYMKKLLDQHGIDTQQQAGRNLLEAICKAAAPLLVDAERAKLVHIHMCLRNIMYGGSPADQTAAWGDRFLVLLYKYIFHSVDAATSRVGVKVISQALPGLWDCLSGLHKWPHGFDKDQDWLPQAAQVIRGGMAEHARIARSQGIPPEEHIRRIVTNAGLKGTEAEILFGMFEEFWAAQSKAKGAAAHGSSRAAEHQVPSQQSRDEAADVAEGMKSKLSINQDQNRSAEDAQQATQAGRSVRMGFPVKAKGRKTKKGK